MINLKSWPALLAVVLAPSILQCQGLPQALPLQPQAAVPGTVVPAAPALALAQAIQLAIQYNLDSKLAKAATEQARGQAILAAAALLPHLTGSISQSRVFKINLAAEGFPKNNTLIPQVLGPYDVFDARISLAQDILNFSNLYKARAGLAARHVAEYQERLAREQVASAAALAYFEAQRTARAVNAAQADVALSQSLLKLTQDQHSAGVATGVDVARSETSAGQERLRLIRAQLSASTAEIRLKRVIGIPLDQALTLPEIPRAAPGELPSPEKAIAQASRDRAEMQVASEAYQAALYNYRSAESGRLPALSANADYGFSGNTPDSTARTGSIGGRLTLPIFEGGEISGRLRDAKGLRDDYQNRYSDVRVQVEEDVRISLQTLSAEIQETQTADQVVDLAQRELKLTRDRYSAGIGDNIQLLTAQDVLDRALDDQVDAIARFDTARVNLAAALGEMETFK